MRAKVTLTCDLSEAPDMVIDILRKTSESLRFLSNEKYNYWQVGELLAQIDSIRTELENIDNKLNDASNIASGWLEVMLDASKDPAKGFEFTEQEDMNEEKGEI